MKYQINYKSDLPIRLLYGFLRAETDEYQIPTAFPAKTDWGEAIEVHKFSIKNIYHFELELGWISIETGRTFYFAGPIDLPDIIVDNDDIIFLIGLGPTGEIAIWLRNELRCMLFLYASGIDITDKMTDKMIFDANFTNAEGIRIRTISELCKDDMSKFCKIPGFDIVNKNDNYLSDRMKKYNYRYDIRNIPAECLLYELLTDATFCKTNNPELKYYHFAAKPYKLAIGWEVNDDSFTAYFWMNEMEILEIYKRFYGAHPETKSDFIISIDAENRKYELALYRQGLKEPVIIPESAYQLIVFKNKFEDFRSENYDQPRGAWIW